MQDECPKINVPFELRETVTDPVRRLYDATVNTDEHPRLGVVVQPLIEKVINNADVVRKPNELLILDWN